MRMMARRRSPWDWLREIEREIEEEAERLIRQVKEIEVKTGCITPLYDVVETDGEFIVSVDLPGSDKSEINLEVKEDRIILEAPCKRPSPTSRHGNRYLLQLKLPEEIEPEETKARYQNGVLEIKLTKKSARRGVRINIQ